MPKSKENQWTVMVYMAGTNDLDSAGVIDLREMKKTGSADRRTPRERRDERSAFARQPV